VKKKLWGIVAVLGFTAFFMSASASDRGAGLPFTVPPAVIGCLMVYAGIMKVCGIEKWERRKRSAQVRLHSLVAQRIPDDLDPAEYSRAVRYTIHKYHLAGHDGRLDMHGLDPGYMADLVAEAVGQDRIARGTMAIAEADRDLAQSEKPERDETA
jgi:hypothetical protein